MNYWSISKGEKSGSSICSALFDESIPPEQLYLQLTSNTKCHPRDYFAMATNNLQHRMNLCPRGIVSYDNRLVTTVPTTDSTDNPLDQQHRGDVTGHLHQIIR